jgi:hypothetical protein
MWAEDTVWDVSRLRVCDNVDGFLPSSEPSFIRLMLDLNEQSATLGCSPENKGSGLRRAASPLRPATKPSHDRRHPEATVHFLRQHHLKGNSRLDDEQITSSCYRDH